MLLSGAMLALAALTIVAFASRSDRGVHAQGLTFTVDSASDALDASPGDSTCATAEGSCTLRAAIQEANSVPGPDAIVVPAGTYAIGIPGIQENADATGDFDTLSSMTITGAGIDATIIDGAQLDRVFDTYGPAAFVTISGMTIRNGHSDPDDGGAVHNEGTLTLSNVLIENSHGDDGGALVNFGTATVLNSVLTHNTAADTGGGIINHGTLTVENTTIDNNNAPYGGGGVNNLGPLTMSESLIAHNGSLSGIGAGLATFAAATLTNVTFSGNTAGLNGGGVSNESSLALSNVTIADNTATHGTGGGLYTHEGGVQFRNTIIAGNQPDQCEGTGGYVSQGNNISSAEDCLFTAGGDLQNTDPMLGPLADNGGPTLTHALLDGSPAIDHAQTLAGCPPTDQRGVTRPQNGQCDIGAYEVGSVPAATPTVSAGVVGDANCDGHVNSIDAALVLQYGAGLLHTIACQSAADANRDGHINSIDAALILQYSAGLLAHLP
jgi:CSLREA domain-containing protein